MLMSRIPQPYDVITFVNGQFINEQIFYLLGPSGADVSVLTNRGNRARWMPPALPDRLATLARRANWYRAQGVTGPAGAGGCRMGGL